MFFIILFVNQFNQCMGLLGNIIPSILDEQTNLETQKLALSYTLQFFVKIMNYPEGMKCRDSESNRNSILKYLRLSLNQLLNWALFSRESEQITIDSDTRVNALSVIGLLFSGNSEECQDVMALCPRLVSQLIDTYIEPFVTKLSARKFSENIQEESKTISDLQNEIVPENEKFESFE